MILIYLILITAGNEEFEQPHYKNGCFFKSETAITRSIKPLTHLLDVYVCCQDARVRHRMQDNSYDVKTREFKGSINICPPSSKKYQLLLNLFSYIKSCQISQGIVRITINMMWEIMLQLSEETFSWIAVLVCPLFAWQ